jgi:hypothetical protein
VATFIQEVQKMRYLRRLATAAATVAALTALVTGVTLAGGWAEVVMVDGSEDSPIAGEESEIRFSLLQHGVTAVDFGEVQVTATNPESGEVITVPATNHGGGSWSAVVTFPVEGDWQIGVAHNDLETSPPTTLSVTSMGGLAWLPAMLSVGLFAVVVVVVLGSMLLIGRRRSPRANATATTVRAG